MTISIEDIKKLRDSTGVSMSACKKALEESNSDMDKAFEILRKKGESKASERSERSTANGSICIKTSGEKGVLLSLLCETDFVARGEDFTKLLEELTQKALNGEISSDNLDIVEIKDAQLKMGENIKIGNIAIVEAPILGYYVHTNNKLASLVGIEGGDIELAKDIAMHASATNPKYLSPEEVSNDLISKEREIWTEQLSSEGKTADIIEKILIGKEKKFREENALLKQAFVKNPEITIESLVNEKGAKILGFIAYSI